MVSYKALAEPNELAYSSMPLFLTALYSNNWLDCQAQLGLTERAAVIVPLVFEHYGP